MGFFLISGCPLASFSPLGHNSYNTAAGVKLHLIWSNIMLFLCELSMGCVGFGGEDLGEGKAGKDGGGMSVQLFRPQFFR